MEDQAELQVVRVGVLSDAHCADRDEAEGRQFRLGMQRAREAVDEFLRAEVDLVVQLGDLIDGWDGDVEQSRREMEEALGVFDGLGDIPVMHLVGNHDLAIPRGEIERVLGIEADWRVVVGGGWRFLLLDGMEVAVAGREDGDPLFAEAQRVLGKLKAQEAEHAQEWGGAPTDAQLAWIGRQLEEAEKAKERVALFHHLPISGEAARAKMLSWRSEEILRVIGASDAVVAHIAGHDHPGGMASVQAVHHLTLHAMSDAPDGSNAFAILDFGPDEIGVVGYGEQRSWVLEL